MTDSYDSDLVGDDQALCWLKYRGKPIPVILKMEDIDAPRAKQLLEKRYGKQRPKSQATIKRMTEAMNHNEWVEALCTPLFLDMNGELLDGQHRLTALAQTDQTIRFMVASGLPSDVFTYIDQNRTRSLKDALFIDGVINYVQVSPTIKLLHKLASATHMNVNPRHEVAVRLVHDYPDIITSVQYADKIHKEVNLPVPVIAVLYFLYNRHWPDKGHEFFELLAKPGKDEWIAAKTSHPITKLRKRLREDYEGGGRTTHGTKRVWQPNRIYANLDGTARWERADDVQMWFVQQAFRAYLDNKVHITWEPFFDRADAENLAKTIKDIRNLARHVVHIRYTFTDAQF